MVDRISPPILFIVSLIVMLVAACTTAEDPATDEARAMLLSSVYNEVKAEVEVALWAFHAADTSRNAEAVVQLLWPEFYMMADGSVLEYDEVVAGSREFLPGLQVFDTDWTHVRITPLDPNHAITSFQFRDSIVTASGELIQSQGPTTFVWEQRDGEWRALYADADHYPIGTDTLDSDTLDSDPVEP